jgi:hypothetical protein
MSSSSDKNRNINKNNDSNDTQNTQVSSIKFMESNIGNKKNDDEEFNNQKYLIRNNTTNYLQDLNYQNNIQKERDVNEKYNDQVNSELRMSNFRIDNSDTVVNEQNISNKLIFPKKYDPYIEYLFNKSINPINTQVSVKSKIYNFDSDNVVKTTDKNINNILLQNNSLEFTEGSDILNVYFDNSNESIKNNDIVSLSGVSNNKVTLNLKFVFENNSNKVIIDVSPNFSSKISFINVYINFELHTDQEYFQNIPLQIINKTYQIYIDVYSGQLKMNFNLPIIFYSESVYNTLFETQCTMTLFNIGNYPTNLLNTGSPQTINNILPYFNVQSSSSKGIQIKLKGPVSANNNFSTGEQNGNKYCTGTNVTLSKSYYENNDSSNDEYYFSLGENINNVCLLSVLSSEIPNVNNNITSLNNTFYWNNVSESVLYNITIDSGNYSYDDLKKEMENKISKVKRIGITNLKQYQYNDMKIIFDEFNNTSYFESYNIFYSPEALRNITEIIENLEYEVTIAHLSHNLREGDKIFINDSLDFNFIDKKYINTIEGHIITNIINNNSYKINITNINKITNDLEINQNGGFSLKIRSPNSISLDFSQSNTFGDLMGFSDTGSQFSITPFSSSSSNYIITNKQSYSFSADDTLIFNDMDVSDKIFKNNYSNYIFLKLSIESNKVQAGTTNTYFYKFQIKDKNTEYYYDTFVDEPIVVNPPINNLSSLYLSWCHPDGSEVNFYGKKFSLSMNITEINNYPENTYINENMSRI